MSRRNNDKLALAIVTTLGAGAVQATNYPMTLVQWSIYSNNGTNNPNITSSTATWQYDDVAHTVTQTGGTFNARFTTAPTSTLFRQTTTGLVIGNSAAASATTFSCLEGNFGGGVGASICGNYNFGANFTNNSTLTYSGSSVTRTLAGDDGSIGNPQSLADLNNLAVNVSGTSITLNNGVCTLVNPANCTTIAGAPNFNKGYKLVFNAGPQAAVPVPAAVWLFGSAVGLLGAARRRTQA